MCSSITAGSTSPHQRHTVLPELEKPAKADGASTSLHSDKQRKQVSQIISKLMRSGNESMARAKKSGNQNRNTAMLSPLQHRPMQNATAVKHREQMNQTMQSGFMNHKNATQLAMPSHLRAGDMSPVAHAPAQKEKRYVPAKIDFFNRGNGGRQLNSDHSAHHGSYDAYNTTRSQLYASPIGHSPSNFGFEHQARTNQPANTGRQTF